MATSAKLTTRVSTKGQVILPKSIRDRRNWGPGARLIVEDTEAGVLLRAAPAFEKTTLDQVCGSLQGSGRTLTLTLEEMDAAVAEEARRRAGD